MVKQSKPHKASINYVKKKILQESSDTSTSDVNTNDNVLMMKMTMQKAQKTRLLYVENSNDTSKYDIYAYLVGLRLMPTVLCGTLVVIMYAIYVDHHCLHVDHFTFL